MSLPAATGSQVETVTIHRHVLPRKHLEAGIYQPLLTGHPETKTRFRCAPPPVLLLFLLLFSSFAVKFEALFSNAAAKPPKLINATVETLSAGLVSRKFTSVDLVKAYITRIAEVNDILHAVTEINPDALEIAAQLDAERDAGSIRGPLHGIPILVKNNIATNDRMNNTAGSLGLLGAKVPSDATVVRKLRKSGAIILGKANLSQWASWRSYNSSKGWSAHGGQVYGAYHPNQEPWGSSSGSAVASSLGLALGSLGTETDGSITGTASFNNIVGIKPTVGLTSRHLVIPISEHQDTVGPMTGTVKDAAYILQAIAGVDTQDNYTTAIPKKSIPDYVAACKLSGLSGSRLGIPRNVVYLDSDPTMVHMIEAFNKALDVFSDAGATVIENTDFIAAAEFVNSTLPTAILKADFIVNLKSYLDLLTYNPNNITSLSDLRTFTQASSVESYPLRDTSIWDEALQGWNNTDPQFWPAYLQNIYFNGQGGLLGALDRFKLDAVLLPAHFASKYAATIGAPIVTVPLGVYPDSAPIVKNFWGMVESAPNIPFGISFLGPKFSEEKLIGMAYAFEQRTQARSRAQPYILPTTELFDAVGDI